MKETIIDKSFEDLKFSKQHLIVILYNALCALNFLHTANVMHRDIKPSNMLIDSECVVKICDFGLARTCLDQKTQADEEGSEINKR